MASIHKQRSGRYRAQVRPKGHVASETFVRFDDAKAWAVEAVHMARSSLKRLGLVGKGTERDRRPTKEELARLIKHFEANPRRPREPRPKPFAAPAALRQAGQPRSD